MSDGSLTEAERLQWRIGQLQADLDYFKREWRRLEELKRYHLRELHELREENEQLRLRNRQVEEHAAATVCPDLLSEIERLKQDIRWLLTSLQMPLSPTRNFDEEEHLEAIRRRMRDE